MNSLPVFGPSLPPRRALWGLVLVSLVGCASDPLDATCDAAPELDAEECAVAHAFELSAELPPARGNAKGDDLGAAQLGLAMFFDARFSSNQSVRCATCHLPERDFQDGLPTSTGLAQLTRNTPALFDVARLRAQFWDGRADSLWSQAVFPLESPVEMGLTRIEIAQRLFKSYESEYEVVFGPLPGMDDAARFPPEGGPGDAAWEAMEPADRDAVNLVVANAGKALDAYQRKLAAGRAPLDRFLAGEVDALLPAQRRGLVTFLRAGCAGCHSGPLLSDETYGNIGLPTLPGQTPDRGRADGIPVLLANPFNADGPYWDGPRAELPPPATESDVGTFRTPPLRNVALSAPYGHDGRFATLREVVDLHLRGGGLGDPAVLGTVDPRLVPHELTSTELDDLLAFLEALNGEYPRPPWANWPD
jgi:cytochrome c peroxidase